MGDVKSEKGSPPSTVVPKVQKRELDYNDLPETTEDLAEWMLRDDSHNLQHEFKRARKHRLFLRFERETRAMTDGDWVFGSEDSEDAFQDLADWIEFIQTSEIYKKAPGPAAVSSPMPLENARAADTALPATMQLAETETSEEKQTLEDAKQAEQEAARIRAAAEETKALEETKQAEQEAARIRAEEERQQAEQEAARIRAEEERQQAEQEAARIRAEEAQAQQAEQEAARIRAEEERQQAEQEAARIRAEEETQAQQAEQEARAEQTKALEEAKQAEQEAARIRAEEERQQAEQEAARIRAEEETQAQQAEEAKQAEQEAARIRAEEEAKQAEQEAARIRAAEEAQAQQAEQEAARVRVEETKALEEAKQAEQEAARIRAEKEAQAKQEAGDAGRKRLAEVASTEEYLCYKVRPRSIDVLRRHFKQAGHTSYATERARALQHPKFPNFAEEHEVDPSKWGKQVDEKERLQDLRAWVVWMFDCGHGASDEGTQALNEIKAQRSQEAAAQKGSLEKTWSRERKRIKARPGNLALGPRLGPTVRPS